MTMNSTDKSNTANGLIDIGTIQSSQQLFQEYSVHDLNQFSHRINNDIQVKRQELRNLVGSKYRDLLNVADDIITMNTLVRVEEDDLHNLVYGKSSYQNKILDNLQKFQNTISGYKREELIQDNSAKVLKNLVEELEEMLSHCLKLQKKFDIWNKEVENEDESFENSEEFINIAIFIYMVQLLFKKSLSQNKRQADNLKVLTSQVVLSIQHMVENLIVDGELELMNNLLSAYLIISLETPTQILDNYLQWRFSRFTQFHINNSFQFQTTLRFHFNTINYLNLFKNKLSTTLIRVIHLNNSTRQNSKNWFRSKALLKWKNWIANFDSLPGIDFPQSVTDLKKIDDSTVNEHLRKWKNQISDYYLTQLTFTNTTPLVDQVAQLSNILIAFKHFVSLADLTLTNGNQLIDEIVFNWKKNFFVSVKNKVQEYGDITDKILHIVNEDISKDSTNKVHGSIFMDLATIEDDSSNVQQDNYLNKIAEASQNLVGSHKPLLMQIDNFYGKLVSIAQTLKELQQLQEKLTKSILSIDDTERDDLWENIASTISEIHHSIVDTVVVELSDMEKRSIDELHNISKKQQPSTAQIVSLVRCLIRLNSKPRFADYFNHDELPAAAAAAIPTTKSNSHRDIIITLTRKLLSTLSRSSTGEIKTLMSSRFTQQHTEEDDSILWDREGKNEESAAKLLPVQPSYKFLINLCNLSSSLIYSGEYSDILEFESSHDLKDELIKGLIDDCIVVVKEAIENSKIKAEQGITPDVQHNGNSHISTENEEKQEMSHNNGDSQDSKAEVNNEEVEITAAEETQNEEKDLTHLEVLETDEPSESHNGNSDESETRQNDSDVNTADTEVSNDKAEESISNDNSPGEKPKQKSLESELLTYCDIVFLNYFLTDSTKTADEAIEKSTKESTIAGLQQIFNLFEIYEQKDITRIHKSIWDFYKNSKSVYVF